MDITPFIKRWSEGQQERLLEIRDLAIATITEPPFKDHSLSISTEQQPCANGEIQSSVSIICKACRQILSVIDETIRAAVTRGNMVGHFIAMDYTLYDLHVSAGLGCHLCSILESSSMRFIKNGRPTTLEFDGEIPEDTWLYLTITPKIMEDARCNVMLGFTNAEAYTDGTDMLSFYPSLDPSLGSPTKVLPTPPLIKASTGDEATFQTIAGWLKDCQETHDRCKPLRPAEPNVPRRLLHLSETTARVVENTDRNPYACLSHRWGSQANVPHKLIEGGQYDSFEISVLPKTFRDAIHITKRLGLEHIWIDCFCIVQGSLDDWIDQSAVMAQIYANSAFTIAALAAQDTHGGCFMERDPLALLPLEAQHLKVERWIKHSLWRLEIEGDRPESAPLHTRAWVVQERLSSSRTIFYGSLGVYWECRCMQASENHIEPVKDVTENFKTMLGNLQAAAEASGEGSSSTKQSEFLDRWHRLLEIYTVCSLTFFSDKLIALSGITRDIEKYSGKQYVQGLWKNDLPNGLLWFHLYASWGFTRADDSRRVTDADFPSWSWASMEGKIQYFSPPGKVTWTPQIDIEEGSHDRRLRLRTWKREVSISDNDDDGDYIVLGDDGSRTGDLDEDYLWYHDEKAPESVPLEIALMQRVFISDTPFLRAVRCLVVTRVDGNVYRRVGVSFIKFSEPRDDPFPSTEPLLTHHEIILV